MSATQAESVYGNAANDRKSFSPDFLTAYERDRSPFSSNNPFRSGSVGSVISSNDADDDDDLDNNRAPYIPRSNREYSLSDMSLPSSRNTSTGSNEYTSAVRKTKAHDNHSKPLEDGPTSKNADFRRRNYTPPNRTSSNRKSTNPFIEDVIEPEKDNLSSRQKSNSSREGYSERRDHDINRTRHTNNETSSRRSQIDENLSIVPPVRRANSNPHAMSGNNASRRREAPPPPKYSEIHRSRRHHRHSSKDKSGKESKKIPAAGLDVIDKLDVTGFYGPGRFHHDGPFDACTPARNKNTKIAPVDAFPINSANNSMALGTGQGFLTEDRVFGRDTTEAYLDYNWTSKKEGTSFDPRSKAQPVHGDTTMGLGSTTFLDGAPAPLSASKAEEAEGAAGLGRKKSLVQRLRRNGTESKSPPVRGDVTYEPISRYSSYPEPGSPQAEGKTEAKTKQLAEPSRRAPPEPAKENGLIRRVKSLKVGRSRN